MNKTELVAAIAAKAGVKKVDAEKCVNAMIEIIPEQLSKGEKVTIVGFGGFEVKAHAERQGRNPSTGETITIAASKAPVFKAGKGFKEAVQ